MTTASLVTTASPYSTNEFCPDADDLVPQYLAMLPRGRAWGEGGPARRPGGKIHGWFLALATLMAALHAAICALIPEFYCSTADVTYPIWLLEYGLPDGCDPYPNLCAKVAAFGGTTCAFYEAAAEAIGWSIACGENCANDVGALMAGQNVGMTFPSGTMPIFVSLAASPAYLASTQALGPMAGYLEAGMAVSCGPDLTSLECLLARIAPAHVHLIYFTF